ncbi:MAG: hypothetical protein AAF203_01050 [Pseudomonadota bacterium]
MVTDSLTLILVLLTLSAAFTGFLVFFRMNFVEYLKQTQKIHSEVDDRLRPLAIDPKALESKQKQALLDDWYNDKLKY